MEYNNEIFVSIIMPVYNTLSDYLHTSINSVLKQSHRNYELIIIDDCSNDLLTLETLEIFSNEERVNIITNPVNMGISYSLNIGLELSRGKYIFRMDSDDISRRHRLKKMINHLENNKKIDILGSYAIDFGSKLGLSIMPTSREKILLYSFIKSILVHPTVVFKSSFINKNNVRYNKVIAEDYDLWIRCITHYNAKISNYRGFTLFYRNHGNQLSKTKLISNNLSFSESREHLFEFLEINENDQKLLVNFFDPHYKFKRTDIGLYQRNIINNLLVLVKNSEKGLLMLRLSLIYTNIKWSIRYANFSRLYSVKIIL